MFTTWAVFLTSAAVIIYAGTKLSQYGDRIADLTGLGRLWIGVLLMAAATSLPELLTTMSASLMQAADLAAGDLFGAGNEQYAHVGIDRFAAPEQTRVAAGRRTSIRWWRPLRWS
ncbi:MAG: hypothetical protein KatS3mg082_0567 [Nitrospiraceae bacterium]|nr:MAG: hypothetical protein KatS3mg082_0567 [Nitrospiraceae bacterium]